MDVQQLYDKYVEFLAAKKSRTTGLMYRPKVEEFITGSATYSDIEDLFKEENLRRFVFSKVSNRRHSPLNWWTTLNRFFMFVRDDLKVIDSNFRFPIPRDKAKQATVEAQGASFKGGDQVNYLPREFDIQELLADEMYEEEDSVVVQAIIALILSTGYQLSHVQNLKLTDFYDDEVPNRYYDGSLLMVKRIKLSGQIAEIMHRYLEYRNSLGRLERNADKFFVKGKRGSNFLEYLKKILTEEISPMFNLEHHLTNEDLRYNMALHSLYQSHGSSLPELIRIFGWKPFLQHVLNQYYSNSNRELAAGFDPYGSSGSTDENDPDPDSAPRKDVLLHRVVRDTKRTVELKKDYNFQCQICSEWDQIGYKGFYAEAHHIQPIGKDDGPDNHANMLVLCPNHHVLFDYGIIAIDPEDGETIYHFDGSNPINGTKLRLLNHFVGRQYLQYHWDYIFKGSKAKHYLTT